MNVPSYIGNLNHALVAKPHDNNPVDLPEYYAVGTVHLKDTLDQQGIESLSPDGRTLKKSEYPELYEAFAKIGHTSEGEEFRLPDFRGRVIRHKEGEQNEENPDNL
jgi:Phage Tail Collar Domain